MCMTAGEVRLGNTSSSGVKRDRIPRGSRHTVVLITSSACVSAYHHHHGHTRTIAGKLSHRYRKLRRNYQPNKRKSPPWKQKKKTKLFQIIHSLAILISATDQRRHGPASQYLNFYIHFYKFYMFISTRLSDSVRV